MIQKNLKCSERMEVLTSSYVNIFLGNKYNSYVQTARNAKVTSTRNVYEKTVMKQKKASQRHISNIYDEAFLRK